MANQVELIRALFADALGVPDVGPDDHFLGIGGDLTTATRLLGRIRAELDVELALRDFLKDPTPAGLAVRFSAPTTGPIELFGADDAAPGPLPLSTPPAPAGTDAAIHVEITERLSRITPTYSATPSAATGETVLLTGASGFVGAFVLADLLSRGQRVAALVRGGEARRAELVQHLEQLGLWRDTYAARLDVVAGDVAEPALGLDRGTYDELAHSVCGIVHCAAWVNHVLPYAMLAAANAHSAAAVLELAVTRRRKPVTFVSTKGVLSRAHYPPEIEIAAGPVTAFPPDPDGYGRSKAVAEAYFAHAADLEACVSVVRIPGVFGDRGAHQIQRDNAVWSWTKAILLTGRYPSSYDLPGNELFQAVPADVVAHVIVDLAQPRDAPGCRFINAVPNRTCSTRDFVAGLREAGHTVKPLDDREWHVLVGHLDVDEVWVAAVAGQLATLPGIDLPQRLPRFSITDEPTVSEVVNAAAISTPQDVAEYVRSL
jgi:thioester reductase-like protein